MEESSFYRIIVLLLLIVLAALLITILLGVFWVGDDDLDIENEQRLPPYDQTEPDQDRSPLYPDQGEEVEPYNLPDRTINPPSEESPAF